MKCIHCLLVIVVFCVTACRPTPPLEIAASPTSEARVSITRTALPTDTSVTQTPTPRAQSTPTEALQALPDFTLTHDDAWKMTYALPEGWIFNHEYQNLLVSDAEAGLEEGIFSTHPIFIVWRFPLSILIPFDKEEYLGEIGLPFSSDPGEVVIDGQSGLIVDYRLEEQSGISIGQAAIVSDGGTATLVVLGSDESTWPDNQGVLQDVLASLNFDESQDRGSTSDIPAAINGPIAGLIQEEEAPDGYEAVTRASFFHSRRSEAYYSLWLQGLDPVMTGIGLDYFQGFSCQAVNDNLILFISYPLTGAQIRFVDSLMADSQKMANAVSIDPSVHVSGESKNVLFEVLPGFTELGESSQAVSIPADNIWSDVTTDYILIRQGTILSVIRHHYVNEPGLSTNDLLEVATRTDNRLQELLTVQPDLLEPASVSVTEEANLKIISQVPFANFTLPDGYRVNDGFTEEFVQDRFNRYGARVRVFDQFVYEKNETSEFAQIWVIYPLDETEQLVFDWILQNPDALVEYFMEPYMLERGYSCLSYAELYDGLPFDLSGSLGEHKNGVTLVYGTFNQDVVVMRYKDLLLATSVLHFGDEPAVADVTALAAQLYAFVDGQMKGESLPPTRTPQPTPTSTPAPTPTPKPSLAYRNLKLTKANVADIAVSPDSRYLAVSDYYYTSLYDLGTLQLKSKTTESHTNQIAFSPDGTMLATASIVDGITLWDAPDLTYHGSDLTAGVMDIAFSPDSKMLAIILEGGTVQFLDVQTMKRARKQLTPDGGESASLLAFTPDGKLVSLNDEYLVEVWDLSTDQVMMSFYVGDNYEQGLMVSKDGHWLIFASMNGSTQIWDLQATPVVKVAEVGSASHSVDIGADSQTLVISDLNKIILWDIVNNRQLPLSIPVTSLLTFSSDMRYLVTLGSWDEKQLYIWQLK